MKVSTSKTPSLRSGGVWIWLIRAPRSRSLPARQECSSRFASSTCSRLPSGSASIPTSPSRLVTVPSISSRIVSSSSSQESVGACSEPITFSGTPASEPGVYIVTSAASRSAWIRSGPMPGRGEALLPALGGLLRVLGDRHARVARRRLVDPGLEARRGEIGEGEGEVAHVALGVEDQRRHAARERLLEQHDPEARLARSRSCRRSPRGSSGRPGRAGAARRRRVACRGRSPCPPRRAA